MKRPPAAAVATGSLMALSILTGCAASWVQEQAGLSTDLRPERSIPVVELGDPAPTPPSGKPAALPPPGTSVRTMLADGQARVVRVGLDAFRVALLENNLRLKVARVSPAIASTRVTSEFGRLDATLRAAAVSVRDLEDASDNNRPTEALESRYTGGEAGVAVPLATGGSLEVGANLYSYETVYLDGDRLIDPSGKAYPSKLDAKLTIPLLQGAGYDANLGPIAVAAIDERISVADLRNMLIRLMSSSEQIYWQLARAWRTLEIQSKMLDLAATSVADIEALATGGVVPEFERDRARFTVTQRRAAVLRADLELRRAMRSVKVLMNRADVPLDADVIVRPDSKPTMQRLILDRARLAEVALENRSELLRADFELRRDEMRLRMAQRAILPKLDLHGSIGTLGIESKAGGSISSLLDGEFPPAWSVGLSFEIPILNRKARGELEAARLARSRTETRTRAIELQILQEVYDAVDRIETTWAEIATYRNGEQDASRNLEGVRELLRIGLSSAMEVSLAIGDLSDAELALLDSKIRYQVALIQLAEATGTALGRQAIEVLPSQAEQKDDLVP